MARWHAGRLSDQIVRVTLALALLVATDARPFKLARPNYSIYHTMDGVFKEVRRFMVQCPDMIEIDELTAADGNYSTTMTVVNVEPGGTSNDHGGKLRLLLNFGEHGRELVSSEIALRLLSLLCDEGGKRLPPALAALGLPVERVQGLLRRTAFKIVPMENTNGRRLVERGQLCERKNGRGVDTNRNWGVHWGIKEPDYDPTEENPGDAPFSEPEARLLRSVAEGWHPHVWLNVHSGMEALFMPYDHRAAIPPTPSANATLALLAKLNARACAGRCAIGSGGKSVGYLAHGTATDYMFDKAAVPISMTWEVYGDNSSAFEDCFRMFNPTTRAGFEDTVSRWAGAILALVDLLPEHPDAPNIALPLPDEAGAAGIAAGAAGATAQGGAAAGSGGDGGTATADAAAAAAAARREADGGVLPDGSVDLAKEGLPGAKALGDLEPTEEEEERARLSLAKPSSVGGASLVGNSVGDEPRAPAMVSGGGGGGGGSSGESQGGGAGVGAGGAATSGTAEADAGAGGTAEQQDLQRGQEDDRPHGIAAALREQREESGGEGGLSRMLHRQGEAGGLLLMPAGAGTWRWALLLCLGLGGAGAASLAWSRPRSRYLLSRWVGTSLGGRRHRRSEVPV